MATGSKRTSRPIGTTDSKAKQRKLPVGLLLIGGAAVIVVLLVVVLVLANRPAPVSEQVYEGFPTEWVGRRTLGNPDAPVVIQAWEDFRCPACAQWTRTIEQQLVEQYISPESESGGQVRLEYHYFPLSSHGETAIQSAQAAECAADQGTFWPYHDRLFAATDQGPAGFTLDRLNAYAADLGLNETQFSQCLVGQQHFNLVQESATQAISMGLNSTPSILVNGQLMPEPFNYPALSDEIQRLVEAAP